MPCATIQSPDYDVIVIGGGPAGSSAAYFLGEAGKKVLLLEKEHLPRYKMCGGGLSVRFLRQMFPFSFDPVVKTPVQAVSYVYRNQWISIPLAPEAISVVMRDELDHYLLSHIHAEVVQGAAVRSVTELPDRVLVETQDGRCFSAAYLVGADGANSIVARSLGLRPRRVLAAAVEAEIPVTPEIMQRFGQQLVFIFGEIHFGYLWIFPKPDHLTIGIGALRPRPGELQAVLKQVMDRYGISLDAVRLHGHPIPIYTHREQISSRRTLLVGDAAGLADPLSGEGIRFAIKSGRLAAESIIGNALNRYERRLFWSIGLNHRLTMFISLSFYYALSPFLFLGTPNPFSTQGVVEMLADRKTAAQFILQGFMTLPIFLLTELSARFFKRVGRQDIAQALRAHIYPRDVSAPVQQTSKAGHFQKDQLSRTAFR